MSTKAVTSKSVDRPQTSTKASKSNISKSIKNRSFMTQKAQNKGKRAFKIKNSKLNIGLLLRANYP